MPCVEDAKYQVAKIVLVLHNAFMNNQLSKIVF